MPTVRAGDVLVVAALELEVQHVRADVELLVTGVGKTSAAALLGKRLATGRPPALVVNIGTAGAVRTDMAGVVEIGYVTQHDFPYAAIEALLAAPLPRGFSLPGSTPPQPGPLPGADVLMLASGDAFVADSLTAARIAALGVSLVDMEAYGYAATCAAFGVPMRCAKAVSDSADESAGDSWLDTIDGCARALGTWLDEQVLAGP